MSVPVGPPASKADDGFGPADDVTPVGHAAVDHNYIDTNGNGLPSGNSTVATIDVFHTQNVQAQLTVTAP